MRPMGWRLLEESRFSSVESNIPAKGVSVKEGASALQRILAAASSAASERVNPSTAPLAVAMDE